MRVSVIGCGHLGIPHAAAMAQLGHQVIGVDTDSSKISALNSGKAPIYEAGLSELLAKHTASGELKFTLSLKMAAEFADVHFLAVGTPIDSDGRSYDTGQVFGAVRELAPYLTRPCTIMGKSTVTVGTTKRLTELVHRLAPVGDAVDVVWNPEFLREGHAIDDTLRPDRIIAGVTSERAERTVREVYGPIIDSGVPLFVMTPETAELTKGAANTFLGMKISYINAVADMCDAAGADVAQLVEALGIDPRIGHGGMRPGIGYGGGCLPKDVRAFTASAGQLGVDHAEALLLAAEAVNDRRPEYAVQLIDAALDRDLSGARVAMLGAAFKAGTNDVRESPALAVAGRLHQRGARVTVHDPVAVPSAARRHPELEYANDVTDAVIDADVVVVGTEWPQYQEIRPEDLNGLVATRTLVDFRNIVDSDQWTEAGWTVHCVGRPSTAPADRSS
ncbi:UDP-glucose/GDP-mannose dehydrogenase family protein [Streptomyces sp. NBC_00233]|uniref:UDP-glucose dehydrogenase family protein n=1 Tax=Streptomyces sp. NBC_00233 TaxID=2975686 RepID=UPI002252E183|nr:UDP-glucose/GDP-mannose dehydrogenase family protein [Streptomyces sp. NBC_00233]MCX5231474.1 UDP-glucose/GDP-mannose dehydrogenase family protein [Streptomyces sp. NBC_00233]MCX5233148.1 UDP-glucose/GDP-mannose dehydrogenase family protein [Streptomyces sp. NBC_00233]MCX5233590.1 UDP-glucose/GDP-mannose dehydrogenase family protein [Streptomyces sp. NBC_00233]